MTSADPSIAELSRQVAEAKGCSRTPCFLNACPNYEHVDWRAPDTDVEFADMSDPARLWELEGELQQAGWTFGWLNDHWDCSPPLGVRFEPDREPGTPEGRVRLVLRAWLEMNGGISG